MIREKLITDVFQIESVLRYRNQEIKLETYNKGRKKHKKQIAFHKCKKKNRWVFGGNRSGKTECGAVESVWLARGSHPYKKNKKNVCGWVVSLSTQVQRDVAQQKVLTYLNPAWIREVVMLSGRKDSLESGIIDQIVIENVFGGLSTIGFKSCDQGREKFQGTSLDFVWFDEEPPFDIYQECRMRVLDRMGEIFGTMTPLKGLTWVYDEIYLNKHASKQVWYETIEWADNPFLSKAEIKELSASMSEDELQSRRFGKFASTGGMVYGEFDENIHVINPFSIPSDWQDNISIDPGLNNPLACHWYAVDYDGNVYVIAEHFESGKDVAYHANRIKEISKNLNWKTNSFGMIEALIDSAANQTTLSSPKNVSTLFYEHGIAVRTNVCKDLFVGINRVKSYLRSADGKTKLFIFKNCTNLIREIKSYFWSNGDRPEKKDDHCLDELRYYIMSRPELPKLGSTKSEITKDKERLARRLHMKKYL